MSIIYIVMGVSGVGKTTIGKHLANALSIPFYDADDFHPLENKEKMASGKPLDDDDRWPWLDTIVSEYTKWRQHNGAVLACSALKGSYRNRLQVDGQTVKLIYLSASYEDIQERLKSRQNHFFNPDLLQSQFDTLEIPDSGIHMTAGNTIEDTLSNIMNMINVPSEFGLIGLGIMGKSLARNLGRNGVRLSLYNRHVAGSEENIASDFIPSHGELTTALGFDDLGAFVNSMVKPRKIFLMVNAGPAVDTVIEALLPFLSQDDVIMDGGNSHYLDTERREKYLKESGIHLMGVGVSGGEEGALKGPSIMPGGSEEGYKSIGNYLERIAAKDKNGNACCSRVGAGGSGHFVKMIHNGIEYAEMQLITEVYDVCRTFLRMSVPEISALFDVWNKGSAESYLLGISAKILKKKEGDTFLIDAILDKAKQKGTGGWSTTAALEIGASLETISQAVMARIISSYKDERVEAEGIYTLSRKRIPELSLEMIKKAYEAARMINHCIGFEALRIASREYQWDLNLSEIARIWTNGCIIRSKLMEEFIEIVKGKDKHPLLDRRVITALTPSIESLLDFTSTAVKAGGAIPVFSSAANYFNGFTRGDSAANLIQAQRDFFGAHTYERKDMEGSFHTVWE